MANAIYFGSSRLHRSEVVSLCDVRQADASASAAADMWWRNGKHQRRSRVTYSDYYRALLKEKDLDIVLIATPDHWHALPMIAAVEAGADVYVQKPISVDVVEGQPCWRLPANTSGSSRLAHNGGALPSR
jgi:predicted dehydrogenase